jgi:integrase
MPLSDTAIRAAKPRKKLVKLSDGGGLYLLIQPHGTKLWRMGYRIGGKQKTLAFGIYPTVSLAQARAKRDAAKILLEDGGDPSVRRKIDKLSRGNTFKLVADELLEKIKREGRAPATLAKKQWLLDFAYAVIGDRPVAKITAPELLAVLRKVEARGTYETARRLRSTCGMVFRYAIATGRAERDPSIDLRGALISPTVKHRAAIIDPVAIGGLLRAIDGYDGQATTQAALRLAPLTFVRPGELRNGEWKEIDFANALWVIPAEKMKMKKRTSHRVPLSRQALAILKDLKAITGESRWILPSVSSVLRPLSENTVNAALRRMGYKKDEMCGHGFRTTASTRLNEMGRWNPDAIERQLAHLEENDVRRAYMHGAEYWSERVAMMQVWADYLDELRETGKVLPLRRESS